MIDNLVPKEVLARSTVLGNKEFIPIDPDIKNAIRGEYMFRKNDYVKKKYKKSYLGKHCLSGRIY